MTAQPSRPFQTRHTRTLVTLVASLAVACASQTSGDSSSDMPGDVSGFAPNGATTSDPNAGLSGIAGSGADVPMQTSTVTTSPTGGTGDAANPVAKS